MEIRVKLRDDFDCCRFPWGESKVASSNFTLSLHTWACRRRIFGMLLGSDSQTATVHRMSQWLVLSLSFLFLAMWYEQRMPASLDTARWKRGLERSSRFRKWFFIQESGKHDVFNSCRLQPKIKEYIYMKLEVAKAPATMKNRANWTPALSGFYIFVQQHMMILSNLIYCHYIDNFYVNEITLQISSVSHVPYKSRLW